MFCDSLFLCARGRGKVYTQMGKFLWSVLGIFSIIRLRIRPCFENRAELCYFNKITIAAIWTKARNEASSLS